MTTEAVIIKTGLCCQSGSWWAEPVYPVMRSSVSVYLLPTNTTQPQPHVLTIVTITQRLLDWMSEQQVAFEPSSCHIWILAEENQTSQVLVQRMFVIHVMNIFVLDVRPLHRRSSPLVELQLPVTRVQSHLFISVGFYQRWAHLLHQGCASWKPFLFDECLLIAGARSSALYHLSHF